ncbi:MAG: hypothetical protein AAGA54_17725 [Myxococcota bacterium]
MKIDMEQFLAMTVALGCAGAIGLAVYSNNAQMEDVVAGAEAVEAPAEVEEPSVAEEVAATVLAPSPMPAEPVDLDEAAGIPPVVPDAEDAYANTAPGPDTEMMAW